MLKIVSVQRSSSDWQEFCRIANSAFSNWQQDYEYDVTAQHYILKSDNTPIGIGSVHNEGGPIALLRNIAIDPVLQGQGHGKALLSKLEEKLKSAFNGAYALVEEHNLNFYLTSGYTEYGMHPHEYNMYFMEKTFS